MNLQREFELVRRTFFPRWDHAGLWKCRGVQDIHGNHALCDAESKTVKVAIVQGSLTLLLIHEICHAAGGMWHSKKWQNRMEKAALCAERMGRPELAVEIREEICAYLGEFALAFTAAETYNQIDDVLIARPKASMMQVADWIRRVYGMTRKEFFHKYKRFRAEFAKKQRYWKTFQAE